MAREAAISMWGTISREAKEVQVGNKTDFSSLFFVVIKHWPTQLWEERVSFRLQIADLSWREARTGVKGRNVEARTEAEASALLGYLSYIAQVHLSRVDPTHTVTSPSTSISNKEKCFIDLPPDQTDMNNSWVEVCCVTVSSEIEPFHLAGKLLKQKGK